MKIVYDCIRLAIRYIRGNHCRKKSIIVTSFAGQRLNSIKLRLAVEYKRFNAKGCMLYFIKVQLQTSPDTYISIVNSSTN